MALLAWIVLAIVCVVLGIAFLQRFYRKSTRDTALLRTGAGGQKVALDGGFFALPILHRVDEINMRSHRILVQREAEGSLLTADKLRVDVRVEFRVRVAPEPAGVAAAAQTFGARVLRSEELSRMLEGRFADVVQTHSAVRTLDEFHEKRGEYVDAVRRSLSEELAANGLMLESVALVHFDQTPFSSLNENNVFNAVGMRRLAEIVADNKKRRAQTESDSEIAVAQTQLLTTKRRIELSLEQEEAQTSQRQAIETSRTRAEAEIAKTREVSQLSVERARLERERELAETQIQKDKGLDQARLEARLALEVQRVNQAIELTHHLQAEALASIEEEQAKTRLVLAQEMGQTEREQAVQQRLQALAVARVEQDAQVSALRVKSEAERVVEMAQAEAHALQLRAKGQEFSAMAEAAGVSARVAADNHQSAELMQYKVELARLKALPELAEKMAKPLEKIESIRIHHLSGLGGGHAGVSGAGQGPMDAIYDMALNLPVLKKLGEALGADLDMNVPQLARAEADHARASLEHQKVHATHSPSSITTHKE
ncbi:flotillin family protein [Hydrogenophaga sp.]|uniref:flotillin family protein n=1 Tax=Hydrogenophaga sp. TaxID=1904254 RepID=UPI003F7077DC